jgi:hypothetical protein
LFLRPHIRTADRCGHGQDFNHLSEERSPVFLQFLDALFQIVSQFPSAFEFTDTLLLFLADHMHSCLFGNFLGMHARFFLTWFFHDLAHAVILSQIVSINLLRPQATRRRSAWKRWRCAC